MGWFGGKKEKAPAPVAEAAAPPAFSDAALSGGVLDSDDNTFRCRSPPCFSSFSEGLAFRSHQLTRALRNLQGAWGASRCADGEQLGASHVNLAASRLQPTGRANPLINQQRHIFSWPPRRDLKRPAPQRLYNPYQGLPGAFDPTMTRQLMELPDAPEFVFSEEAAVKHRGWSENLTFITGAAYLTGALAGGAYGSYLALSTSLPTVADSSKLRLNRVLNMGGARGRNLGNTLGVLGLLYSGIQSLSGYARAEHDSLNSVVAATGTGALYKAAAGPRAAAVWGAGCAPAGASGGGAPIRALRHCVRNPPGFCAGGLWCLLRWWQETT